MDTYSDYYRSHRRQFFWQILLPLILLTTALLIVFFLVTTGGERQVRLVADVALLALLLPMLLIALGGIVLLGLAIVAMARLLRWLPAPCAQAQRYVFRGCTVLRQLADQSVRPVFWTHQAAATLRRAFGIFPRSEHE